MRVIRWGDGTRWGDINARWGSPSYVLEPGDPGYRVPPPPEGAAPSPKPNRQTMSNNATPTNRTILLSLAHSIHAGQLTHAASVGLMHHLAAGMDAAIKKLEGDPAADPASAANKGSQLLYRECVDATRDAEAALRDLSDGPVKTWLDGYRTIMKGIHGSKPNAGWVAAGFAADSNAVPRKHEARRTLLGAARSYLVAHPTYEASLPQPSGPALAITAAQALALQTQMQTADTLINTRTAEQVTCKTMRDADVAALYDEVSGTTAELSDILAADDARWEVFGLNIPAHPNPPGAVASLTVTAAGAGRELASWEYATRAEYYRIFLQRIGIDPDPVNVEDARDLEYTFRDLVPGTTIKAYVIPMNDGGPGPASPTVTKVVGA